MERIDRGGGCFELRMTPGEIRRLNRNTEMATHLGVQLVKVLGSRISTKPIVAEDLDEEVVRPHN